MRFFLVYFFLGKNEKYKSLKEKEPVIYGDFMIQPIHNLYKTIIGNPPFIRTKKEMDFI